MLVGIGFVGILTAALAERFVAQEVAEAEEEVVSELGDTQALLRRELREITSRLAELERRI